MKKNDLPIEVRDMRNGDWYWISRLVYEEYAPKIKPTGLALYNAYASYARDKGSAYPSQARIAKKLGISDITVRKYNKILKKAGLITIDSGKTRGTSNIVYLLKVKGSKKFTTPSKNIFHLGSKKFTTKETQLERNEIKERFSSNKEKLDAYELGERWGEKPYFRGQKMRWLEEKGWWVIPEEGGQWLEFAGKESEIEWE